MNHTTYRSAFGLCSIQISGFTCKGGTEEQHIMIRPFAGGTFSEQLKAIHNFRDTVLMQPQDGEASTIIFQRYFISDAANQAETLEKALADNTDIPTSVIQQPPLDGSKIVLWIYLHIGACNSHYKHLWTTNKHTADGNVYNQSELILKDYSDFLTANHCSLKDNCIRTWFYVHDVDTNYADFVKARKEYFDQHGLTHETHYIASTGIEGRNTQPSSLVTMDAYAIAGIVSEQVKHMHALSHLSPTHVYGVTFERGVAVRFGDRQHVYISGTASIDNQGQVVHVGDAEAQTYRMLENIEALLKEADATMNDMIMGIVYLRDTGDYQLVKGIFEKKFPDLPMVITLAPVCRPTWLVEMECIAINSKGDARFAAF